MYPLMFQAIISMKFEKLHVTARSLRVNNHQLWNKKVNGHARIFIIIVREIGQSADGTRQ